MVSDWVVEELESTDVGDKRLNDRLREVLSMMAATPSKSIPASANGGHNETTAAYRLFDNDRMGFENILEPHIDSTYKRLSQEEVAILGHDTSELDLTRPKVQVEGAGPLDGNARFGELLHPLVAFTPNGTPLGTLCAELWTRESGPSKAKDRKQLPIEEKESLRWLETHRHAQEIAEQYPETKIVAVADSEADIFEVIDADKDSPENFQWIIRGCYDRATIEDDDPESILLREKLSQSDVRYTKTIAIRGREKKLDCDKRARNQPRESRQCEVEVRAQSVTLRSPHRPDRKLSDTTVNVVWAHEINAPDGDVPVDWMLLTNMPVSTKEEIELILSYYCIRWMIENYQARYAGRHPLYLLAA
ncbi:Transposase for transposon Tn5 [Rubripirellula obstinata]|uniref:Transposase for transposon Tn5 n=1 Tax=Rubripirellula obstinata TaxID=406547 RepID=A0A5B1CF49_9BACT|nr:IS4 family transposase [Rubripirellula obstinata]KAA1258515.1 Transposase for transposon Tn5 [Rubripirellula obstinata]